MGLLNKNRSGKGAMRPIATETWNMLRSYEPKIWQPRRNMWTPRHTHLAKTELLENRKYEPTFNS